MTRMTLAERRQKLIEAALQVIARDGMAAATTRAIAAEAGMPLASFHYAFESHQTLLGEAMEVLDALDLEHLTRVDFEAGDWRELFAAVMGHHLDDAVARRDAYLSHLELTDHALRTEGRQTRPAIWRRRRIEWLQECLADFGAERGEVPGGKLDEAAEALAMACDGVVMRYLATGDEEGTRRTVDHLARMLTAA